MICINCHGPDGAADGRFAQNLATMTGGLADVADFRDGLFGPTSAPDSNIAAQFGTAELPAPDADAGFPGASPAWANVADEDRAARYMAWMGLGGTPVTIPIPILEIVAVTKVLDQERILEASALSANMLSQAKALCLSLVGPSFGPDQPTLTPGNGHGYFDAPTTHLNGTLIWQNGDAELWLRLCSQTNPPPIHVLRLDGQGANQIDVPPIEDPSFDLAIDTAYASGGVQGSLLPASVYPAGTAIGNEHGAVDASLLPTNLWPWCIDDRSATPSQEKWLNDTLIPATSAARCPPQVTTASDNCKESSPVGACFGNDAANQWAVRGAINAGFSVFLYVQSLETRTPPPDYNQCELLQ